ncbi:MAG TPA: ribbon-helix-helix protein, CopG family [Propionibacterium sp.]|nr:ribbon-helix-helix protein, CopG family [Propionibacterium sp.]
MRTTLTIDDDVLEAVKEQARKEGRTVGNVLSDLARRELTRVSKAETSATRNGFPVLRRRGIR